VEGHYRGSRRNPRARAYKPRYIAPYFKGPQDKPLKPPVSQLFVVKRWWSGATASPAMRETVIPTLARLIARRCTGVFWSRRRLPVSLPARQPAWHPGSR